MSNEQYIIQLAQLEQEANKFQEQMQLLDQQVAEIQGIQSSINELEKSKEKTIYADIGKNIFVKSEIVDKNLLVDVGNRTFIKKTIPETIKLIDEQLDKIAEAKSKIILKLQELQEQMQKIIEDAEKEK